MKPAKREFYRERLQAEREQLIHELERIRNSIPEEVHPLGEHETSPSEGVEADVSLAAHEGSRLRDVDAALQRFKTGTFGKCGHCGRAIAQERLQAVPSARHCASCETALHTI